MANHVGLAVEYELELEQEQEQEQQEQEQEQEVMLEQLPVQEHVEILVPLLASLSAVFAGYLFSLSLCLAHCC